MAKPRINSIKKGAVGWLNMWIKGCSRLHLGVFYVSHWLASDVLAFLRYFTSACFKIMVPYLHYTAPHGI
jgi:hypothetical protein